MLSIEVDKISNHYKSDHDLEVMGHNLSKSNHVWQSFMLLYE